MTSLSARDEASDPKRVTIRDVARLAGVGTKTVSRVINNEIYVAPATALRVRDAIHQLRWEPDLAASNLRRTQPKSRSIGLLLGSVANPFSAAIHRAVEDLARENDIAVLASSLDEDPAREVAAVGEFLRRRVDGLILTRAAASQAYLRERLKVKAPVVFIDRHPVDFAADVVTSANWAGAALATEHLIAHGHRRMALLLDRPTIWTAVERRRGFLQTIDRAGLTYNDVILVDDIETAADATAAVNNLLTLDDPPTAIFSAQNLITIGAIRALRQHQLQNTIALIGFDDIDLADLIDPGISVVAQRPSEIGRRAAEIILARLSGETSPFEFVETDVDLICRGSGEIPPNR